MEGVRVQLGWGRIKGGTWDHVAREQEGIIPTGVEGCTREWGVAFCARVSTGFEVI